VLQLERHLPETDPTAAVAIARLPDDWDAGTLDDGTVFYFRKDNPSEVSW
jgi:hypothetical protein